MYHAEARVSNPSIPKGRVTTVPRFKVPTDKTKDGTCCNCNVSFSFLDLNHVFDEKIEELACSNECAKEAGFYPPLQTEPESINVNPKRDKKDNCPHCGGIPASRGWAHSDDCKMNSKNMSRTLLPPCSECGGKAAGKGYSHSEHCSKSSKNIVKAKKDCSKSSKNIVKAKKAVAICPECSGPALGKGYSHSESCSKSSKNIVKNTRKKVALCPECDGPARGRGYTHNETCSKYKSQNSEIAECS